MAYYLCRHGSPKYPISTSVCNDPVNVSHSHTPVHPYSSVSDTMGQLLSGAKSPESCYVHSSSDRYSKLDSDKTESLHDKGSHSCFLEQNLISSETRKDFKVSPAPKQYVGHMTREEKMASIRDDIGRFSKPAAPEGIPHVSSRWSKFMNDGEPDREGEEEEGGEGERVEDKGGEGDVHVHMLQSKLMVAKYD